MAFPFATTVAPHTLVFTKIAALEHPNITQLTASDARRGTLNIAPVFMASVGLGEELVRAVDLF